MIRLPETGVWREVHAPRFGSQDRGESPGGAQDRFSWECARILLGDSPEVRTWELVLPPVVEVLEECVAVLTGGDFDQVTAGGRKVYNGTVFRVKAGERIQWGTRRMGFRTYLAVCPLHPENEARVGMDRGVLSGASAWRDPEGMLRVLPGPEADRLLHWRRFLQSRWVTGLSSSDEGLRLQGEVPKEFQGSIDGMISAPVVDGTLQLTPDGMILLLRSRPTVGGYPRMGVVVDADVDLAAQLPPRRRVRFRTVGLEEAVEIAGLQKRAIRQFREKRIG